MLAYFNWQKFKTMHARYVCHWKNEILSLNNTNYIFLNYIIIIINKTKIIIIILIINYNLTFDLLKFSFYLKIDFMFAWI